MAENGDSIQGRLIASLEPERLASFRADQMVYLRQRFAFLGRELDPNIDPRNAPLGPRILKHLTVMMETAQTIALVDARLRQPVRRWIEGACCERAERAACVCALATVCDVHGERHKGTHD